MYWNHILRCMVAVSMAVFAVTACKERDFEQVREVMQEVERERQRQQREEAARRRATARNPPIAFENLTGEWISNYSGGRTLRLRGLMVNKLGEPLNYACDSKIVVRIAGKQKTFTDDSDLGTGCGDVGMLSVGTGLAAGKSKKFSNWAYYSPEVSKAIRQYTITRIDWSLDMTASTPLGDRFEWTAAQATLPPISEKARFPLQ